MTTDNVPGGRVNGHRHRFDAKGEPVAPGLPLLCIPGTCEYCDPLATIPARRIPRSGQHDVRRFLFPLRASELPRSGDLTPLAVAVLDPRRPD